MKTQSWGDGSLSDVLVVQAWEPDFDLQHPHKCEPVTLALLR